MGSTFVRTICRQVVIPFLAGLAALVAGCLANRAGVPCSSTANCPSGMQCLPAHVCGLEGDQGAVADRGRRADASAWEWARPDARGDGNAGDRRAADARRPDAHARIDATWPDTLAPDAWPSCALACVAALCNGLPASCEPQDCGWGFGKVPQCATDSDCCDGVCSAMGNCGFRIGGPCYNAGQCASGRCSVERSSSGCPPVLGLCEP